MNSSQPGGDAPPGAFFSREALSSVPWLLIGKILTFFLYFAISIIIVRSLGPTDYGVYSLLGSMADYLMVFCTMGLNQSLLRFVPELTTSANRAGLRRFLLNSVLMQGAALLLTGTLLYALVPWISQLFHIAFGPYVLVVVLFTAMLVTKEFLNNLFTSLFMARFLAVTSVGQAIIFIIWLVVLYFTGSFSVKAVLIAFSGSIALMALLSLSKLQRFFKAWKDHVVRPGIGRRRVLKLTLPMTFMAITNKLLSQYSEIFFLGYFASHAILGYYSLGLMLANQLLTFVPMALQTLFTTALSEAYSRHKASLGDLTAGVFQALIIITVPLACFGAFFAHRGVEVVYGSAMAPAGLIASFFCIFRLLPMIWIPLSMALTATEKVANTMWLNVVHLGINLSLDYILIKHFGLAGALAAIVITFLLVSPLKLWVIRGLLGGIFFPLSFFIRVLIPSVVLGAMLFLLIPSPNLLGLFALAGIYAVLWIAMIRFFKVIRPSDIRHFKSINIRGLNKALDFMTGVSVGTGKR